MSIAIHSATAAPMYESIVTRSLPHRVDVLHHQGDEGADRSHDLRFELSVLAVHASTRGHLSARERAPAGRYASSSFPSATAR